ncbi:hypothetical protein FO519_008572 [Halicephalobus sp. NKZ332]|nr:hypothetical protein FO519_008572 [Halicephalobus sp. NKZ332]
MKMWRTQAVEPRERAYLWITVLSFGFSFVCLFSMTVSLPLIASTVRSSSKRINEAIIECTHSISEIDSFIFILNKEKGFINKSRVLRYIDPYAAYGRQPVSDF